MRDGYAQVAAQIMAAMLDEFAVRLAAVSRGEFPMVNRKRKVYEVKGKGEVGDVQIRVNRPIDLYPAESQLACAYISTQTVGSGKF